jgi:cobalt-zinc-cadmium efflux system outer membrane protein
VFSLEQVLKILDERSPRTAAERATIEVTTADRITAGALPNPSLSYGGSRLVSGASTGAVMQHQFVIDQPLLLFGQRQTRRDLAELNVSVERARVATILAGRRLEVRQAFASLVARQEELRILQDSQVELERIACVVRGRAQAGDTSQYDVMRIETENRSLQVEVMNAATNVEDASGHLASLLGFPAWLPEADGTLTPGSVPTELDALWDTAQQRRPALVAIRQRQSAAQGELALARRERLPVPALSTGVLTTREVTGTSAFVGLSVPLALFDRNRGPIAHAAAEIEAERLAGDAEIAEARAEIERTQKTFLSRRRTLAMLEGEVVRRLPDLRRMAEDAYREGKGGILELLDASRSLTETHLLHVRQHRWIS